MSVGLFFLFFGKILEKNWIDLSLFISMTMKFHSYFLFKFTIASLLRCLATPSNINQPSVLKEILSYCPVKTNIFVNHWAIKRS